MASAKPDAARSRRKTQSECLLGESALMTGYRVYLAIGLDGAGRSQAGLLFALEVICTCAWHLVHALLYALPAT